ncbi:hypothetical protein ACP4OV_003228 [Aristida adscensionis]
MKTRQEVRTALEVQVAMEEECVVSSLESHRHRLHHVPARRHGGTGRLALLRRRLGDGRAWDVPRHGRRRYGRSVHARGAVPGDDSWATPAGRSAGAAVRAKQASRTHGWTTAMPERTAVAPPADRDGDGDGDSTPWRSMHGRRCGRGKWAGWAETTALDWIFA